ncbi:MAG: hypothetical protein H6716_28250 [Polyangiaceae bacterium]|nr:hypothetical protein [Polyangiaceae bacterium]
MRVEMVLYHGLEATGSIWVSADSAGGPWTELRLTQPRRVSDALAEWQTLAEAAFPTYTDWFFGAVPPGSDDVSGVLLRHYDVPSYRDMWAKLPECLWHLLGFTVDDYGFGNYILPLHLGPYTVAGRCLATNSDLVAVGLTFPVEVEEAELTEYRAARANTYHHSRASEVTVDFLIDPTVWPDVRDSPLWSGHAAFWVTQDDEDDFGPGNFDGALMLFPIETAVIEQDSPEDRVWIRLRCTRQDYVEPEA